MNEKTETNLRSQVEANKRISQLAYIEGALRRLITEVEPLLGADVALHLTRALQETEQAARRQGGAR